MVGCPPPIPSPCDFSRSSGRVVGVRGGGGHRGTEYYGVHSGALNLPHIRITDGLPERNVGGKNDPQNTKDKWQQFRLQSLLFSVAITSANLHICSGGQSYVTSHGSTILDCQI